MVRPFITPFAVHLMVKPFTTPHVIHTVAVVLTVTIRAMLKRQLKAR